MLILMVGVELKSFNDQRGYTNEIVRKYIFPQYSFVSSIIHQLLCPFLSRFFSLLFSVVPMSLSWTLILIGAFGMEFATLSICLDPLGPEVAGPTSPRLSDSFFIRDFFGRCSKWTMSLYLWHAVIINAGIRIAGHIVKSDATAYMFNEPIWKHSLWLGDFLFLAIGLVYFAIMYALFCVWEKKGKGIGTFEWMLGMGARGIWAVFGNCCCWAQVAYDTHH